MARLEIVLFFLLGSNPSISSSRRLPRQAYAPSSNSVFYPANPAPASAYVYYPTTAAPTGYVTALCGVYSTVCKATGALCVQYCTICSAPMPTTTTPYTYPGYGSGSYLTSSAPSSSYYYPPAATPTPSLCPPSDADTAKFALVSSTLCTLYGAICKATGTLLCKEYGQLECVAPSPEYQYPYYGIPAPAPAPVPLPTALCANFNGLCDLTGTFCKESCALCPQSPAPPSAPSFFSNYVSSLANSGMSLSTFGTSSNSYYATTPAPSRCPAQVTAAATAASAALCNLYGVLCSQYNVLCPQYGILCGSSAMTTTNPTYYVAPAPSMSYGGASGSYGGGGPSPVSSNGGIWFG